VWDDRKKYPKGSLVSFHGMKYEALSAVSPGRNPQDNNPLSPNIILPSWMMPKPCRRTNEAGNF
jgi:hypothetical protein